MSVALAALRCSSTDAEPGTGADTGGTGATVTGGSGGTGGGAGAGGTPSGGVGTGGVGAAGTPGSGGAAPTGGASGTGGTSGMGGTAAGMPSGGAGAGGAAAGGASGSGATAGNGTGGAAGAGGRGGAGGAGAGGKGGAGGKAGTGSGGAPNCTSRTGGAIIDLRACNQTMRFWITNGTFITEAIRLRGNGQSRIACFPQPEDGRDCDPVLTYHANPANPYWTDFELETYFTCPQDVESNKSFWLEQVGQFCGQMTSVTAVDDNR